MIKHKDLEVQLIQAKYDQATMQLQDEQQINQKEKELVCIECVACVH